MIYQHLQIFFSFSTVYFSDSVFFLDCLVNIDQTKHFADFGALILPEQTNGISREFQTNFFSFTFLL